MSEIFKNLSVQFKIPELLFAGNPMVSIDESKTFCLYCRGEINHGEVGKKELLQSRQYHQECFDEIIKDNHCEYCSKLLNELNIFFTEEKVKIHQKCLIDLKKLLREKIADKVEEYLLHQPIKKLAKDYAFYEMKEEKFTAYVEEIKEGIDPKLPDYSAKSKEFQQLLGKTTNGILQEEIAGFIKKNLQLQLDNELKSCKAESKKELVNKTLQFVWNYYLEIPFSYKDKLNHKILPKPSLDSVNCTIFHFKLEKLFNTSLDFNSIVNNNYNEVTDYLLGQSLSLKHLQM